jgi:hypothetical protein
VSKSRTDIPLRRRSACTTGAILMASGRVPTTHSTLLAFTDSSSPAVAKSSQKKSISRKNCSKPSNKLSKVVNMRRAVSITFHAISFLFMVFSSLFMLGGSGSGAVPLTMSG